MIRKVAVIDDNDGDVADSDAPVIDYSILQHTNAQSWIYFWLFYV